MTVLILTLFATATTPGAMTTAEFSSEDTCRKAATAWKNQAKWIDHDVKLTAVCMPK